jgi:hypothetical protein
VGRGWAGQLCWAASWFCWRNDGRGWGDSANEAGCRHGWAKAQSNAGAAAAVASPPAAAGAQCAGSRAEKRRARVVRGWGRAGQLRRAVGWSRWPCVSKRGRGDSADAAGCRQGWARHGLMQAAAPAVASPAAAAAELHLNARPAERKGPAWVGLWQGIGMGWVCIWWVGCTQGSWQQAQHK